MPTHIGQLQRAIQISEQIEQLETELNQILKSIGGGTTAIPQAQKPATAKRGAKKGGMSAEGRARIIAAQKARWAKMKGPSAGPATAVALGTSNKAAEKKKGGMSPEGRARIIAAQKSRWARVRAAKASRPSKTSGKQKVTAKARQKIANAGQPKFRIL